ncbi:MAG: endonuclease/exonuclease/phosphatase family protein [Patescibacteria group bacterium]
MHHGDVPPQIADGLLKLKKMISDAHVASSKIDETINVAIWNIREFGKVPRTDAAIHYIAEILGQFDLISLVELRDNLSDLKRVLPFLGPSWDIVYSDWIDDPGGNKERTAFLFDTRGVTFNGLAAEVDAPRAKKKGEYLASQSFWRAPYMCSFRSGNFDFIAIALHARWGEGTAGRKAELQMLANWIERRTKDKNFEDKDLLVMGDFNTPKITDEIFKAITSRGLQIPDSLVDLKVGNRIVGGSNMEKTARYDQILHMPSLKKRFANTGGTVDFYLDGKGMKQLFQDTKYTPQEFSFQISDHFPIWVQIKTEIDGERLNQIVQNGKKSDLP